METYFALKMLVTRFPGVQFYIVSPRRGIRKFCQSLGIRYFQEVKDIEFEDLFSQRKMMVSNFGIGEYVIYGVRRRFYRLGVFLRKYVSHGKKGVHKIHSSSWFLLMSSLLVSILLISLVLYFSVPRTYIQVNVADFVQNAQTNVILSESEDISENHRYIPVKKYIHEFDYEFSFAVTSVDDSLVKRSEGRVEIFNYDTTDSYQLVPGTRLQTEDGMVFTTKNWVNIPEAISDEEPTSQRVDVIAQVYDTYGEVLGQGGNISEGIPMVIPGLGESFENVVYGKSITEFSGGSEDIQTVLTQEEFDNLKELFYQKMFTIASTDIRKYVQVYERSEGYDLIPIAGNILLDSDEFSSNIQV